MPPKTRKRLKKRAKSRQVARAQRNTQGKAQEGTHQVAAPSQRKAAFIPVSSPLLALPPELLLKILSYLHIDRDFVNFALIQKQASEFVRSILERSLSVSLPCKRGTCRKHETPKVACRSYRLPHGSWTQATMLERVQKLRIRATCSCLHDANWDITSVIESVPNIWHLTLDLPSGSLHLPSDLNIRSLSLSFRYLTQCKDDAATWQYEDLPEQAITSLLQIPSLRSLEIEWGSHVIGILTDRLDFQEESLHNIKSLSLYGCGSDAAVGIMDLLGYFVGLESFNITLATTKNPGSIFPSENITHADSREEVMDCLWSHTETLKKLLVSEAFQKRPSKPRSLPFPDTYEISSLNFQDFINVKEAAMPYHIICGKGSEGLGLPRKTESLQLQFPVERHGDYPREELRLAIGHRLLSLFRDDLKEILPNLNRLIFWLQVDDVGRKPYTKALVAQMDQLGNALAAYGVGFEWLVAKHLEQTPLGEGFEREFGRDGGKCEVQEIG